MEISAYEYAVRLNRAARDGTFPCVHESNCWYHHPLKPSCHCAVGIVDDEKLLTRTWELHDFEAACTQNRKLASLVPKGLTVRDLTYIQMSHDYPAFDASGWDREGFLTRCKGTFLNTQALTEEQWLAAEREALLSLVATTKQ